MSVESRTETAWKGFFLATIGGGTGAAIGMIAGFIIGSLADTAIFAITGNDNFLYGYVLAKAGTYIGIVVGMTVGIRTGVTTAASAINQRQEEQKRQLIG
jgi:uncharacterized membrane protein AbrB (regulator of aidB expression)